MNFTLDIDQVRTFLAVAANGSFLEAATRLHVAQSAVSVRIDNLETGLGTRLFVRNRSGAALTAAGRRFTDVLPGESCNRGGDEMRDAGLYVDLKPWQCHLFRVHVL